MQKVIAILLLCVALGYLLTRLTAGTRKKGSKGGCCGGGCGGKAAAKESSSLHGPR
jgi:hypothetical protein